MLSVEFFIIHYSLFIIQSIAPGFGGGCLPGLVSIVLEAGEHCSAGRGTLLTKTGEDASVGR